MKIENTTLPGVILLEPQRFGDNRGFFAETYNAQKLEASGIMIGFVQDNQSLSHAAGTVRGLHFQAPPHAQDKLVRCSRGALIDIALDIRRGSPTYGSWVAVELSAANGRQLLVPKGFAHGFATLQPDTEILYKCSDYYFPECEGAIRWNDPIVGSDWARLNGVDPILSDKDIRAPGFAEFDSPFVFEG